MSERHFHRPMTPGDGYFEAIEGGPDPLALSEAADRAARLLVRGTPHGGDEALADRVVRLADDQGLETLAELWAGAPADSLAGCLWRLYLLRTWVHRDPVGAAAQFEAGRLRAPVARVVAGVAEPPGPDELKAMVDQVLRGIVSGDFADVLFRAAAFAHVVAVGRATLQPDEADDDSGDRAARLLALAEQLERAGHLELTQPLI